ncbi:MAG TPA: universal stress protein [Bryobacteraceae bacterium]|nr:universal stress protein [Bryobacteraceae bacterium]
MYRHILAPVDFSPLSGLGLRWAGMLARCGNARLTVLYASPFDAPPYFTAARMAQMEVRHHEELREAEEQLRTFTTSVLGSDGPSTTIKVVEALPVDAIITVAEGTGADLIVMGTHGRSGFNRVMLGSVAERVLRQSSVPVLTVRGDVERPIQVRHILCPLDSSPAARSAMSMANGIAACTGANVTAVHVLEPGAPPPPAGVQVVRQGNAAAEIVAASAELPCDLLVMGARRRRFYDATVIGTTTARVVRHASCPVLTVVVSEANETREAEA